MSARLANDQLYISSGDSIMGGNSVQLDPFGFYVNSTGAGMSNSFSMGGSGTNGSNGNGGWNFYNYYINTTPSNGENFLFDPNGWFGPAGFPYGSLYIGGTLYQNWYSDAKYKDNVTPISGALNRVNAMRGVEFDWNALAKEEQGRTGHDVGVIAQEVQAVYPFAVREVDKEREDHVVTALVVDYEKLIPLLLQSIKELSSEVNSLKQQVNGTNI